MRADLYLCKHGLADSRSKAAALIKAGVTLKGTRIEKVATEIPDDTDPSAISLLAPLRYVSRGGEKLEAILALCDLDLQDIVALDIGASTGGFTDCLLQHGVRKVYALDVGHDQLAPSLRTDSRVCNMEGINAKTITAALFDEPIDLVVTDVSFISQSFLYEPVATLLADGCRFLALIKPQFEVGRQAIGKGGIVRDPIAHREAISRLLTQAEDHHLAAVRLCASPITGGDGNREYLVEFVKNGTRSVSDAAIRDLIKNTFRAEKAKG